MSNLLRFFRLNKQNGTPTPDLKDAHHAPDNFTPDNSDNVLEVIKKQIQVGRSRRTPMVIANTREVILERVARLFAALHLELLRDGWTLQNHRLHDHIKSICWQLPDDAEAEGLEDLLDGMLSYEL